MLDRWNLNPIFLIYLVLIILFVSSYFYFLLFKSKSFKDRENDAAKTSMMLDRGSRGWFLWIGAPIENFLLRYKIRPSTITWTGVFFAITACISYSFGMFAMGGLSVILVGACDTLDGRVARKLHLTSRKGEFLDANLDRLTEIIWFLGLFNYYANTLFFYIVFLAFAGSQMVSYSKARGESMSVTGKVGIMQRPERLAWLGATSVLSPFFSEISNYTIPISQTFLASLGITVIAVFTLYTYYQRFQYVYNRL